MKERREKSVVSKVECLSIESLPPSSPPLITSSTHRGAPSFIQQCGRIGLATLATTPPVLRFLSIGWLAVLMLQRARGEKRAMAYHRIFVLLLPELLEKKQKDKNKQTNNQGKKKRKKNEQTCKTREENCGKRKLEEDNKNSNIKAGKDRKNVKEQTEEEGKNAVRRLESFRRICWIAPRRYCLSVAAPACIEVYLSRLDTSVVEGLPRTDLRLAPTCRAVSSRDMSGDAAATTDGAPLFSYLGCVNDYLGFLEVMRMSKGDPTLAQYYEDGYQNATRCAAQLNSFLCRTPDVVLYLRDEEDAGPADETLPPGAAEVEASNAWIVFPASPGAMTVCPFEVHYDGREWIPCVILEVVPASTATGLSPEEVAISAWTCTVGVLGYNAILTDIPATSLRPFDTEAAVSALEVGLRCHAVHPRQRCFAPCVVQRLTLEGTVVVRFDKIKKLADAKESDGGESDEAELPLSHVRVGRVHKELRRLKKLTPEEKRQMREDLMRRKEERSVKKIVSTASEWQSAAQDLFQVGSKTNAGTSAKKSTSGATKQKFLF
eukprot:gene8787-6174_t